MKKDFEKELKNSFHEIDREMVHSKIKLVQEAVREQLDKEQIRNRISYGELFRRLIPFIFWKIWLVQGAAMILMCICLLAVCGYPTRTDVTIAPKALFCIASMIPFVSVPFLYRSRVYQMQEIEMSTSFSYVQQMLVKLLIIAVGDLMMLGGGIAVGVGVLNMNVLAALLYGVLPILIVSSLLLFVSTRVTLSKAVIVHVILFILITFFGWRVTYMYPKLFNYELNTTTALICLAIVGTIVVQLIQLTRYENTQFCITE